MLTDVHKPLRGTGPAKIPTPTGPSSSVDMRMRKAAQKSQGQRLANARDRTSVYALSQDPNLSDYEKEQMRKQLKDRFTPGARPVPGTVQGLAALANERIEDAIARGQFKNITRGKGKNIERDYTASSPFLDTTEYFMNKIIQKQEIVPPWIEKQQELVKAAAVFRSRLRADWKRHAARMIASRGGSLEAQIAQAKAFAAAEETNNAKPPRSEALSEIDMEGRISQAPITPDIASLSQITDNTAAESTSLESNTSSSVSNMNSQSITTSEQTLDSPMSLKSLLPPSTTSSTEPNPLSTHPFRDPSWEALEHKYHTLAITSLNNLTRSYNLQAPTLAKKPYFSLARELAACYADTAPLIPGEILARASAPKQKPEASSMRKGGLLDKLGGGSVRVVESRAPHYGFRQFWKDVWGGAGDRS